MRRRHWTFAAMLMLVSGSAFASNPYMEYKDHIKASQNLTALKDNLFGDNVSLYNGATEFTSTDIDIPGNNALPVQLTRRLSIEIIPSGPAGDWDSRLSGAGNWDIDVPYISGTYISGGEWPTNRCTSGSMPSAPGFSPTDFWHGNPVHIPGSGDRPLLGIEASTPRPSDGLTYKWSTRERDGISCLASVQAGAFGGEGFRLKTSSGLIYTFDVPIQRYIGYMKRPIPGTALTYSISRVKDYLLASRIEDRFGNYVTYTYNSQGHPTQISSNDGRTIALTYDATGAFLDHASINTGTALRTWNYTYGSGATAGMLTAVALPDASRWSFAYSGSLYPYSEDWSEDPGPNCNLKPPIIEATFAIAITHPSGAVGTFDFANLRHFRSGVHHGECIEEQQQSEDTWVTVHRLHTPHYFDVMSLQDKTISGPGLTSRTWTYDYGITHEDLYGAGGQIIYPCPSGCDVEKTVTVTNPDSTRAQYQYGMLYAVNEGKLLGSSVLDTAGNVKRTQATTYMTDAQSVGQNFFARYGIVYGDDDPSQAAVRPVISSVTTQDGTDFISVVLDDCSGLYCFDQFARPTKTIKASMAAGTTDLIPPSGIPTLTVPATSITGSYTASWTSVPYAATYQLQERLNGGAWATIQNTAATSKALSGKANGLWDYQVRACNSQGCAGWSAIDTIEVMVPPSTAPTVTAPASSSNGNYTVTWTTSARATRYELDEVKDSGAWTNIYNGSATSKARSLSTSGTYKYRARACNNGGCSVYSTAVTTTVTITSPPPAAPATLTAPATVEQWVDFNVSWSSVSGAASYKLERNDNSAGWAMVFSGTGTYASQSLTKTGSYQYRAQACNTDGVCGAYSPTKVVTVTRATTFAPAGTGE